MKPSFKTSSRLLASCIVFTASPGHAADSYWDANAGSAGTGGSGSWNLTGSLWRDGAADGTLVPWTNGNAALLGGTYGTLTTTAAIQVNQFNGVAGTTGTAPFVISNGTGGSLAFVGASSQVNVPTGFSLTINPRTMIGAGAGLVTVQGGGTLTMAAANRAYGGSMKATGAGTLLSFTGTNGLNLATAVTGVPAGNIGLTAENGGTIRVAGLSNYGAVAVLSGGTLQVTNSGNGLVMQNGSGITVTGTARSAIIGAAGAGLVAKLHANGAVRPITVNPTGDASGYDLEISASSGTMALQNYTFQKNGAGVMRLLPTAYVSFNSNLAFDYTKTSLIVNGGTLQNEGRVYAMTTVATGATAKTGTTAGSYDAVTVNTGGIFEISRETGTFTSGLTFEAGQNSLTFNGGTLKYAGVATDLSASFNALSGTGGIIDTNSQNVVFATALAGTGGLTKAGAGSLSLAAANTYTGSTTVTEGTLSIAATGSIASTVVDLRNGATLDTSAMPGGLVLNAVGSGLSGVGSVVGNLTLGAAAEIRPGGSAIGTIAISGACTLAGSYRVDLDSSSNDLLTVSGAANLAGCTIVPIAPTLLAAQPYTLLSYGTLTGLPVLDPAFAASRYNPVLNPGPQTAPGNLVLSLSGTPAELLWSGKNSAVWSVGGALNWTNGGTDDGFKSLDMVVFDDSATGNFTVTLPAAVSTMGMTFNNLVETYVLTGPGAVSGYGGLDKKGGGKLVVETNNTFTGPIFNDAGILQIGSGGTTGALGGSSLVNNGQLIFHRSDDVAIANAITGTGTLEKLGTNKLTLTTANGYSGKTTVNGGTLSIAADNHLGSAPGVATLGHLVLNGTLEATAAFTLAANRGLALGPAAASGAGTIDTNLAAAAALTYNGVISDHGASGSGGLIKAGAGILALGGSNTYSGATVIKAGSIDCSAVTAFGVPAEGTTVEPGAWIYILNGSQAAPITEPFTIAGNGAGFGALRTGSGGVRYTLAGPLTLAAAATLYNDGNTAIDLTAAVTGIDTDFTLSNNNAAATCTLGASLNLGAGGFIKDGTGTVILDANNSYGPTTITKGTLQVGSGGISGSLGSGAVFNNGALVVNRSGSLAVGGDMTGTGSLTLTGSGTLTLGGASSYTGLTSVNAGTLMLTGSHTGGGAYTVAASATLGGGGTTTSAVALSGTLAPGNSIGSLATGPLVLNLGAKLAFEINTSTGTADRVVVTGDVTVPGATVDLALADLGANEVLPNGTKLTLLTYSGTWEAGKTLSYKGAAVANGTPIVFGANTFTVQYADGTALTLTALATTTPYESWIKGYTSQLPDPASRLPEADPDADGVNNLTEFALKGDPASGANNGLVAAVIQDTDVPADTRELTLIAAVRRGVAFTLNAANAQQGTVDGVTYTAEGSLALASWTSAVSALAAGSNTAPLGSGLTEDLTGTAWEYRTFSLNASEGTPGRGFLRVKATP